MFPELLANLLQRERLNLRLHELADAHDPVFQAFVDGLKEAALEREPDRDPEKAQSRQQHDGHAGVWEQELAEIDLPPMGDGRLFIP